MVANHVSFFDPDVVATGFWGQISFVIAEWVKNTPLYGSFCVEFESEFVPRGDETKTNLAIEKITKRTKLIEEGKSQKRPLVIFPAGYCTNGTHTVKYKKGAFAGLNSCRPVILKYNSSHFSPNTAGISELSMLTFLWCSFTPTYVDVSVLPVFTPNEHLFEHGQGKEKWEKYMNAVR